MKIKSGEHLQTDNRQADEKLHRASIRNSQGLSWNPFIPNTAFKCPISTSRNWRREKNTKKDNDYIAVTQSWLPVKDQTEVAQELGATIVKHARWISPIDVDEVEWAKQFKDEIQKRERSIAWFLKNNDYTDEIRSYLNQQYVEDAVNDEAGDGDFMDRQLLEVG